MTDDELLSRARIDPAAVGELFERHATHVHRYLSRRGGVQLADDLLGEVFVVALRHRTRVVPGPSASALPWLYGIAGNLLRSQWRRHSRPAHAPAPEVVDWAAVDARIDAEADRQRLRLVLDQLTVSEREVLLLIAWEGLSVAEAAKVVGVPPATARVRLHRARRHARAVLAAAQPNS